MKQFFQTIPRAIALSFRGYGLAIQVVAWAFTYLIVTSGYDWQYFLDTRSSTFSILSFPAIALGALLPIVVPVGLIVSGRILKHTSMRLLGWALGQSALLGWIISSCYKAVTGRIPPNIHDTIHNISAEFQFGFLRHGIFWGWPSSHTTVAFAMAFTVICLFPRHRLLNIAVLIYACYIGFGVSLSIHWFSEFIAGALIGSVIGVAVAKGYERMGR